MKKILISMLALLVVYSCSSEDSRRQRLDPGQMAAQLQEKLDLTDIQRDSIKVLIEQNRQQMRKLRQASSGDMSGMREVMMELRAEHDEKVKALLNDEQKEKYEEILEERRQNFQRRFRRDD